MYSFAFKTNLRFICAAVLIFSLSACVDIVPKKVSEVITVSDDGQISVAYKGSFGDLYDMAMVLNASKFEDGDEERPPRSELESQILKKFKNQPGVKEIHKDGPSSYHVDYFEVGNLNAEEDFPSLLKEKSQINDRMPGLVSMEELGESGGRYVMRPLISSTDFSEISSKNESDPLAKEIHKIISRVDAEVVVKIKRQYVLESNAGSVSQDKDGRSIYRWKFNAKSYPNMKMIFSFASSRKKERENEAKEGDDCVKLFGTKCKCGPFRMAYPSGEAQKNMPYVLSAGEKRYEGCTDENGDTMSVDLDKVGKCSLGFAAKDKSCAKK